MDWLLLFHPYHDCLEAELLAIIYRCRHCGNFVGKLPQHAVSISVLGLDKLSAEDRKQMVVDQANGDMMVRVICENCEQTLQQHPHYYELNYFLQ